MEQKCVDNRKNKQTKKKQRKIKEAKSCLFVKTNKIHKHLATMKTGVVN